MTTDIQIKEEAFILIEEIDKKEYELKILNKQLDDFKCALMEKLKSLGLESLRKNGYNFTLVQPMKKAIDKEKALDIILAKTLDIKPYVNIDTTRFVCDFGEQNEAVSKVPSTEYIKISKVK